MAYLTFDYLNERKGIIKKAFETREIYDYTMYEQNRIFLSHRHKDIDVVKEAVGFLQQQGGTVYVDYLDDLLPDKTNFETASILRDRISQCPKFILLATPNSSESKWIPWELGIGDRKGLNNVAILPLLINEDYWKEREYYKIYGSIETFDEGEWGFFPPNKVEGVSLSKWLTKNFQLIKG